MVEGEADLRAKRWRLALGDVEDQQTPLTKDERHVDELLEKLYPYRREGGLPQDRRFSAKWFGEIKELFPTSIVKVIQQDLVDRLGLPRMLKEPEVVQDLKPDLNLVTTILALKESLPKDVLEQARILVEKLAHELTTRLRFDLINRLSGRRRQGKRISNPRLEEVDWHRTIQANLKYYQKDLKTIIPVKLLGMPRSRRAARNLYIMVDQSASMLASYIFSCVIASILASIPSLRTRLIIFDTDVVDLSDELDDPVGLMFRARLGGGTHITKALAYAEARCKSVNDNYLVLISDLYEGVDLDLLLNQTERLLNINVRMVNLLALDEQGKPDYDEKVATEMAALGVASLVCTPDKFPLIISDFLNDLPLKGI